MVEAQVATGVVHALAVVHRHQPIYLAEWDRSPEKVGHWLKKLGQFFPRYAHDTLANTSYYMRVRNLPS